MEKRRGTCGIEMWRQSWGTGAGARAPGQADLELTLVPENNDGWPRLSQRSVALVPICPTPMMCVCGGGGGGGRAVLKGPDFFFLLRTAPRDHQPPTANSHQPPTATSRQPLPTATNHQSPTTNRRQPPLTATNRQLLTANRQLPPTMVEHMECPRAFLGKLVPEHFFFPVKDRPGGACVVPALCQK